MNNPYHKSLSRRSANRTLRRYLIVCEDSKSSADYLCSFKIPAHYAEVITIGGEGNTDSLVRRAIEYRIKAIEENKPYLFIWCVFDRDDFPLKNYANAFELTRKYAKDMGVIWANESFELWYLLHYCYRNTSIGRHELTKEFSKYHGKPYDKANSSIYAELEDRMPTALKNARTLERHNSTAKHPERENPSTNIHVLVEKLLELRDAV